MVSFTVNLEVMSRVETQRNETFSWWNEMRRRDATPVKINGSKTSSFFEKLGNITLTS